jgi:hypothetical protein
MHNALSVQNTKSIIFTEVLQFYYNCFTVSTNPLYRILTADTAPPLDSNTSCLHITSFFLTVIAFAEQVDELTEELDRWKSMCKGFNDELQSLYHKEALLRKHHH